MSGRAEVLSRRGSRVRGARDPKTPVRKRRATALQLGRQGVAPVYEVDEEPNLICREVGLAHHLLGGCGDIAEEPSGIEQHPSRVLVLTEPLGAMNDDA